MKKINAHIIHGFTDAGTGGNPAGVVFNADDLSGNEKQVIATRIGMTETAFVSRSQVADYKLEFFTPTKQIPHCGHATIAVFSYLSQKGLLQKTESSKETIDGNRRIVLKNKAAYMEQKAPRYISVQDEISQILDSLHLRNEDLVSDAEPCIVNTGNSFLVVGVKNKDILKRINYNTELVYRISEPHNLIGFYVFSKDTVIPGKDATARMFGPYYGIPEESATGMAAGPLACYLFNKLNTPKSHFEIEQGHFMSPASPSLIHVDLELNNNTITSLLAGGTGKLMRSFEIGI